MVNILATMVFLILVRVYRDEVDFVWRMLGVILVWVAGIARRLLSNPLFWMVIAAATAVCIKEIIL